METLEQIKSAQILHKTGFSAVLEMDRSLKISTFSGCIFILNVIKEND